VGIPVPSGLTREEITACERPLCACGCGEPAPIVRNNCVARGYVKGEFHRFVAGHGARGRRFPRRWSVEDHGHETPCWIWGHVIRKDGYGQDVRDGRVTTAHVSMYEELVGPIPDGLQIDHLCRVRACINPDHLEPVTPAENTRRGNTAKLTMADAEAIRASSAPHTVLANEYGVHPTTIYRVRTRELWAV
jgi:hypothetical protein